MFRKKEFGLGVCLILVVLATVFVFGQSESYPYSLVLGVNNDTSFYSGDVVNVPFVINVSGPFYINTLLEGRIGNNFSSISLKNLFDIENITYVESGMNYSVGSGSSIVDLVYPQAGKQILHFKIFSGSDNIQSLDMTVVGFDANGSYASFPSMDIDNDGNPEWQYFGNFLGYLPDFTLPAGLDEQASGGEISVNGESKYYCEKINLPYGRDFEIYVKARKNASASGNLRATGFSFSSTGNSIIAYGGSDYCEFSNIPSGQADYDKCELHLNYSIQGDTFVCVYNINQTDPDSVYYFLDSDSPTGQSDHLCVPSSNAGEFSCTHTGSRDYFIKLKGANYSKTLGPPITFSDWFVDGPSAFMAELNSDVGSCIPVPGGCIMTLEIDSQSAGRISLQNLNLAYEEGGSGGQLVTSNNFYILSATGGQVFDIIGGVNLTDGALISLDTERLLLTAPSVLTGSNFTLNVSLNPGPSDSKLILVYPRDVVTPEGDLEFLLFTLKGYLDLFNMEQSSYGDALDVLGVRTTVSSAISSINGYYQQALVMNNTNQTGTNQTNLTESQRNAFIANVTLDVNNTIQNLPKVVNVVKDFTEIVLAEPSDITNDMILQGDVNDENKLKVFYEQSKFTVNAKGQYIEAEFFNGSKVEGSVITKTLSGGGSGLVVFEIIPNSIVIDSSEVSIEGFTKIQTSPVAIFKKEFPSLSGVTYSYGVSSDIVIGLSGLKTVIVPKNIAEGTQPLIPVCGDGVCTVLELDGKKISLEDAASCPVDCGKKIKWGGIFVVVLIGILIVVAVGLYTKYGSKIKGERSGGFSKKGKPFGTGQLFSSAQDEANLRNYVKSAIKSGMTKAKLTNNLMARGWKKEQIEQIFKSLGGVNKGSDSKIKY